MPANAPQAPASPPHQRKLQHARCSRKPHGIAEPCSATSAKRKPAAHHLAAADGAVQDAFVEDAPELGRTRSVQNGLAGQPGGYLLIEVVQVAVGAGGQDRAGILFGLQQARDDERLVPAQHRGPGFDADPSWNQPYRRCLWPFFR